MAVVDGTDEVGTVHLWHLYVGYQYVELCRGELFACLSYMPAHRQPPFAFREPRKHLHEQLQLQLVVVDDYDVKTVARWQLQRFLLFFLLRLFLRGLRNFHRNCDEERSALPLDRLQRDVAAKQGDELTGDGQSQTHALYALRSFKTREGIEHPPALLRRHSLTCVRHAEQQSAVSHSRRDTYLAHECVFQGVAEQIVYYLTYAESVAQTHAAATVGRCTSFRLLASACGRISSTQSDTSCDGRKLTFFTSTRPFSS